MTSRPQQIADMLWDAAASLPPPEDNQDAYEALQALAHLAEAVGTVLDDFGEKLKEHTNVNKAVPEAIHEAADGVNSVADQLRDIPPPPPEKHLDGRGQEIPDWVEPYRYTPHHIREDHPLPPLPGELRRVPKNWRPPETVPPPRTDHRPAPRYPFTGEIPWRPGPMASRKARERARRGKRWWQA